MDPIRFSLVLVLAGALSACAAAGSSAGARTVFDNPYAVTATERTGIGPQCDVEFGRDATCLGAVVASRGRTAVLANGDRVRLTRDQARLLRERSDLLRDARAGAPPALPNPPSPPEPELPTADNDAP